MMLSNEIQRKALSGYGAMKCSAISDLFFNQSHDEASVYGKNNQFERYDEDVLMQDAESLLSILELIGVDCLPKPEELVADFYNRL